MKKETKLAKLHRLMEERPEMFDFGDIPPAGLTEAQQKQADEMRPQWMKARLQAKAQVTGLGSV